jgi:hypothetical protein
VGSRTGRRRRIPLPYAAVDLAGIGASVVVATRAGTVALDMRTAVR